MKTALTIFLKIGKKLKKVKKIEDFQILIEFTIKNFGSESDFKQSMQDLFVNENLYYYLRKLFISIENSKPRNKPSNQDTQEKPSTLFVKDRASIFGLNGVVSLSNDHLGNLQPSYFLKGGMGRKSKFTSMFNLRKKSKEIFGFSETVLSQKKKSKTIKILLTEKAFSLDNFLREKSLIQIRRSQTKTGNQVHSFSFRNIFTFSPNVKQENEQENDLFSAREIEMDTRAKKSNFIYETPNSLLYNFPMEVNLNSKTTEDLPFLHFFFKVSNSQMLEKMEEFLVNYLTLSKVQRKCFNTSNERRKSLQSVLSILKKVEPKKEFDLLEFSAPEISTRTRSRAQKGEGIREKMLKTIFSMRSKQNKSSLHKSLEPRLNKATFFR